MIAIRPGRRASWRERADRRTDMLRAPPWPSCWSDGGVGPDRPADPVLYAAKEGGRNRSCADLAEAAEAAGRAQG